MSSRRDSLLARAAYILTLASVVATTPAALTAQEHDPAPIRVHVEAYGQGSGSNGRALALQLDASGADATQISIAGGAEGDFAFLLLGADRASVRGPFDTHFLVQPLVILHLGRFDASGAALQVPVDLVQRAPSLVHMQALSIPADVASASLSEGMSVRFVTGTEQPQLDYKGPASTAILIQRGRAGAVPSYELLHRVYVPTSDYTLRESHRESIDGVTRIYMNLDAPRIAAQVFETKRRAIALGSDVEAHVEVWIRQTQDGQVGPEPYERAAVIERDF